MKLQINDLHSCKLPPDFNNVCIICAIFFWESCTFACICYIRIFSANSRFFSLVQYLIYFTFNTIWNRWNTIFISFWSIAVPNEFVGPFVRFSCCLSWGEGVDSSRFLSDGGIFTIKSSSLFFLSPDDISLLSNIFPWSSLFKLNKKSNVALTL